MSTPWGEFVDVAAYFLKAGEVAVGVEVNGLATLHLVLTTDGERLTGWLEDQPLADDGVGFSFTCIASGTRDSLLAWNVDNAGSVEVFDGWLEDLRTIALQLRGSDVGEGPWDNDDPLHRRVSFLTLWHCAAGKTESWTGDDYWEEWELEGVVFPEATGVRFEPLTTFVPKETAA